MLKKISTALALCGLIATGAAQAQSNGPIHLVIAFPPGGPTDFVGRTISEEFSKQIKRNVIIDNKPGANGNIAGEFVARSAPDGNTLFFSSVGSIVINPSLYPKMPYDVPRDFAPVAQIVNNATILVVNSASPFKTAVELVEASKKSKEPIATASTGIGGMPHLAIETFIDASKANLLHVPYKGAAPAITDLLGQQVGAFFGDIPGLIGHIRGGKLRAIGIAGPKRSAVLPDVKTMAEQGYPSAEANNWYGIVAPAKVPAATIAALNAALVKAVNEPGVHAKLVNSGAEPQPSTPAELGALMKKDTAKWAKIIKEKNIKAE
ncbi:MAG TPA: tripartite tricarboxylate transporter substrate binding protein [Burkholderiales bacterium]|jgi:tripartite-type tricarboxylate transporter receptor subunit TctC